MTSDAAKSPPQVFVSYSWDSEAHKEWVKAIATRLRADGVDVVLDRWGAVPGDQLPKFMETAIRQSSYVLLICTPHFKTKADARTGGVGYEGDIMTGEVHTDKNDRKFIPVVRAGSETTAIPSWLKGKYRIDLTGDPYSEGAYKDLLLTLHNQREQAPPVGKTPFFHKPAREDANRFDRTKESPVEVFEPIKIERVLLDEIGRPRGDGSRGSALYPVPFKLNRAPTNEWGDLFIQAWDRPPQYTSMHRPGIARVEGDRIVLTGTTIEEVKDVHQATLKLAVEVANNAATERVNKRRAAAEAEARRERERQDRMRDLGEDIKFE